MKTKYLLPSSWRPFGIMMAIISVPLTLWILVSDEGLPIDSIPTPWHFAIPTGSMPENIFIKRDDGTIGLQIIDELLGLGNILGLFILGFSRLKVEDERIAQIRLESLQWGIYANYLVLALCIVFVYGEAFFTVMIYNIFTSLLIFVVRFYWLLLVMPAIGAKKEASLI